MVSITRLFFVRDAFEYRYWRKQIVLLRSLGVVRRVWPESGTCQGCEQ